MKAATSAWHVFCAHKLFVPTIGPVGSAPVGCATANWTAIKAPAILVRATVVVVAAMIDHAQAFRDRSRAANDNEQAGWKRWRDFSRIYVCG